MTTSLTWVPQWTSRIRQFGGGWKRTGPRTPLPPSSPNSGPLWGQKGCVQLTHPERDFLRHRLLTRAEWDQRGSRGSRGAGGDLLRLRGTGHHLEDGRAFSSRRTQPLYVRTRPCFLTDQKGVGVSIVTWAVAVLGHALLLLIFCHICSVAHLYRRSLPLPPAHAPAQTNKQTLLHLAKRHAPTKLTKSSTIKPK